MQIKTRLVLRILLAKAGTCSPLVAGSQALTHCEPDGLALPAATLPADQAVIVDQFATR
jgi:hypothetical protein